MRTKTILLSLILGALPAFAAPAAAQTMLPIWADYSDSSGYTQRFHSFYIGTADGPLATSSIPADVPFTIKYDVEKWVVVPMLLPEDEGGAEEGPSEEDPAYIELWRGSPFTPDAAPVQSWYLEENASSGQVTATITEPGPHFIAYFGVLDPGIPLEQMRSTFRAEYPPDMWFVSNYAVVLLEGQAAASDASNVLFLPGIKGSRLYDGDGNKLWEPFGDHDVEALGLGQDGKSLQADIHTQPGDIVDSVAQFIDIYGSFSEFMDGLVEDGVISEWRAAPYDWRLSLPDIVSGGAEEDGRISYIGASESPYIRAALETLAESSWSGKVTIVAHSNGGLVAKELMRALGDEESARLIDKVIFVGVPQSGAPQALGALLYGYKEGLPWWFPGIVSTAAARAFAENSPMGYHLLPSDAYFRDVDDEAHAVVRFGSGKAYEEERAAYGSLVDSFAELASFARADDGGREKPSALNVSEANVLNAALLEYAEEAHETLDAWTPPEGVELHQVAGWGEETVSGIEYYERCVLLLCYPKYRPTFVEDGDGVVPVPSALMTSEADNVERYWLNLRKFGFGPIGSRDHGDLMAIDQVQDFIETLLLNAMYPFSETLGISEPHGIPESRKLRFYLHSPLTLEVLDEHGNRIGPNEDGSEDEEIPGATYGRFGEVQYVIVPAGEKYQLSLEGYEAGTFTLEIEETEGSEVTASIVFAEVLNTENTFVRMEIDGDLESSGNPEIDLHGTGDFETLLANTLEKKDSDDQSRTSARSQKIRQTVSDEEPDVVQLMLRLRALLLELLLKYLQENHSRTINPAI